MILFVYFAAPKTPKIDTDEFDGKIQQLITMGISEVRQNQLIISRSYTTVTMELSHLILRAQPKGEVFFP